MQPVTSLLKDYPLASFFAVSCAISWTLVLLFPISVLFVLLAPVGPALAALLVTWFTGGEAEVLVLLRRVTMREAEQQTYAIAIGLPLVAFLIAQILRWVSSGVPPAINLLTAPPIFVLLVVLVAGEELGWRGFALPRLRLRYGDIVASLMLGAAWAFWRLATATIPGLEYYLSDFPALLFYGVAISFWFTWLAEQSEGSVWMAWVFHAAINLWGTLLFIGAEPLQWWFAGGVFALAALLFLRLDHSGAPPTPLDAPRPPRAMPTLKGPTRRL
jgi:membrane protease YdiL (CAAX protease family)